MDERNILTTKRLVLRPVRLTDAMAIQRLFPHWRVTRYLSEAPWPYPKNGAISFLRRNIHGGIKRGTMWVWAITLKGGHDVSMGIISIEKKDKGEVHRGFWISPTLNGQGLMTEAVIAVNAFAFERAGIKKLTMLNAKANRASARIKHKTGGRFLGYCRKKFIAGIQPAEIWELTKEDWETWKKNN